MLSPPRQVKTEDETLFTAVDKTKRSPTVASKRQYSPSPQQSHAAGESTPASAGALSGRSSEATLVLLMSCPLFSWGVSPGAESFQPHGHTFWGGWHTVCIPAASLEGFDRLATSVTDWSPVRDLLGLLNLWCLCSLRLSSPLEFVNVSLSESFSWCQWSDTQHCVSYHPSGTLWTGYPKMPISNKITQWKRRVKRKRSTLETAQQAGATATQVPNMRRALHRAQTRRNILIRTPS